MLLTIQELSDKLNVSKETLRRWERDGKLTSERTEGKHRRYDLNTINTSLIHKPSTSTRKTILYARVSTHGQKEDLIKQIEVLKLFATAKGYQYTIYDDLGSGLNYKRKNFVNLLNMIMDNEVEHIIITHKDRLMRFGYDMFYSLIKHYNVKLTCINQDEEKVDDNKEFVDDVLGIITHFSAKLYGKRSHKNKQILTENSKLFNV